MKRSTKLLPLIFSMFLVTACGETKSVEPNNSTEPEVSENAPESKAGQTSKGGTQTSQGGQTQTSKTPATSIPSPSEEGFAFSESELNDVKDFHTQDQKAYLAFTGDYYHITTTQLDNFHMSGRDRKSNPEAVTLRWSFTPASGKTVSSFQVKTGQKSDLSDGYIRQGTTATSLSFYNPFLGDNYFQVIAKYSDGTTKASEIKKFKVVDNTVRNIKAGNLENVRDTGGRTTTAGGKIRQGLIFRTCGNKYDYSTQIDAEGKEVMLNYLGVKTEINVADNTTYNFNFGGSVKVVNAHMDYGTTAYSNVSRNAEKIRQVFATLADENNYPAFYHCRIGTDRTGTIGICLNGLLGVPFNEILQDYGFSNFAPIDGQRYANKPSDPNGDDAAKYIEEIKKMPGATYQEQTYNALLSIGIPAASLDKIIDIMTEGPKATFTTNPRIGLVKDMTLNGTSKQTKSDFSQPDEIAPISSGKSVSYKVNTGAGESSIVLYAGCTSKSGNLGDHITLSIDGTEQTVVSKSMTNAGFGTSGTRTGNRTAYMFNVLGKYNLTEGEHTITVAGKSSTTLNVGTIGVFGPAGQGGGQGGQGGGTETHEHNFTYGNAIEASGTSTHYEGTCSCGKKAVKWSVNTNTSGQTTTKRGEKLSTNGNYFEYKVTYTGTLSGKLYVLAGVDTWNQNSGYGFFYNNAANLEFSINGTVATITNTKSYAENGCQEGSDTDETKAALMEVCAASLQNGTNTIKVTRKGSRSATMYDFFVIED